MNDTMRPAHRLLVRLACCAMAGTALAALPASPSQAAPACPAGAWRYHQARPGGCAHGTAAQGRDSLGHAWFKISGTVGDTSADGDCARVEVRTRLELANDSNTSYRVCGSGEAGSYSFSDIDTASGLTGAVQAWSVRLCVGSSCSAFVDFQP